MSSIRSASRLVGALLTAALAVVVFATVASASVKATTITIWTDKDRAAAVQKVASAWGASKGVTVNVVTKDFGSIRDNLKTVDVGAAPDVVVGAHDWTGELAANGLVLPLFPSAATLKQFPAYALSAFSYGTAVKRLYGAPVALENIALVTNTKVAKVPKTFSQLESEALAFQKKSSSNIGLAVQQGTNGDAYHMYPFFSGLCGYIFGTNKAGNLDPSDIGVANKKFLANTSLIDKWNKEKLINAKVDSGTAQNAFTSGKAAFWITGPWNIDTLRKSGIKFAVSAFPKISCNSVPFLGVQGFMVTKFSTSHGVEALAKDLVSNYMMQPAAQLDLAAANGRFPANLTAGKQESDPVLKQFGKASVGGVPMPNIPQMNSVWGDLGGAWVNATKGSGATPAKRAFSTAARNIANKIG
jgi:arabinogalactan oligomer/maltooligosaccharide transport system substrate-binding protein